MIAGRKPLFDETFVMCISILYLFSIIHEFLNDIIYDLPGGGG